MSIGKNVQLPFKFDTEAMLSAWTSLLFSNMQN